MVSLILTLYYMGGRGTLCMDTYRITSSFSANAPYELRFHDFVSSNISKVLLRPFFKNESGNFEKLKIFFAQKFLEEIEKKLENWIFFQESYFFILNLNSTCF